jgi:protein CpxP
MAEMVPFKKMLPPALLACTLIAAPFAMADTPPGPPPGHPGPMQPFDHAGMLEQHIAHLHDALKVTPQQEEQWKPVAQTMRDNEKAMFDLMKEKHGKIESQTAVDDLNAYSDIAAAHAVAARKMADVFAVFYASLGDDQKKLADEFFREHKHHSMSMQDHPRSKKTP